MRAATSRSDVLRFLSCGTIGWYALAALLCGLSASVLSAGPIAINGSFNDWNGISNPSPSTVHGSGAQLPPGWTTVEESPDWAAPGFDTVFAPTMTSPPDGGNWMMGYSNALYNEAFISQTISGFQIGSTYRVSFFQAHNSSNTGFNLPGNWNVTLFGRTQPSTLLYDQGDDQVWFPASVDFVASATTSKLLFTVATANTGISLDSVTILAVPEPAAFALGLLGLVGLVFVPRPARH